MFHNYFLTMVSKGLILCLALVTLCLAQTNFNNNCQNASLIPKLATGVMHLNPLDTYNNGANKDYYVDLSLNKFEIIDVLGYGFALAGFQASCSQSFYSLSIFKVTFENQNTRMRVVVDFRNPGDGAITTWNLVTYTYIVVSRTLNGAYSDIWASVAEIDNPSNNVLAAIDSIASGFQANLGALTSCAAFVDPNYAFSTTDATCNDLIARGAGGTNGNMVIHAYIMGFRYNPVVGTTNYLQVGVGVGTFPFATTT